MTSGVLRLGEETDEGLLTRIRLGDPEAFDALYARHGPAVFRFAYSLSGASQLAEDCTQEVFMQVWRDSGGFRPGAGTARSWLLGIARHKLIDRFRQQARYELGLDVAVLRDSSPTADQRAGDEQRAARLQRAILALPLSYREVVILCELEELSYLEAASLIDCPVGTIRSRLYRARRLLAGKLRATPADSHPVNTPAEACR